MSDPPAICPMIGLSRRKCRNLKRPFWARGRVPTDLWVVKDASRRPRMRDVSGPLAVRGAGIRGAFWPLTRAQAKWNGRLGEGAIGSRQAIRSRSNSRAGDRGGARAGKAPIVISRTVAPHRCFIPPCQFLGPHADLLSPSRGQHLPPQPTRNRHARRGRASA